MTERTPSPDPPAATPATPAAPPGGREPARRLTPRRRLGLIVLGLLLLAALDLSRPPEHQLSARFLLAGIDLYQATLSPRMPSAGVHCRFTPTCSHFAEGAIRKDGALVGSIRTVGRIARCGPWTPAGTHDPP